MSLLDELRYTRALVGGRGCIVHRRAVIFEASSTFSKAQSQNKRQPVLQDQDEVMAATAEPNCVAVLNIDSLIYFNLNHHRTGNKPEWLICSQLPVQNIVSTVKQRGAQPVPL